MQVEYIVTVITMLGFVVLCVNNFSWFLGFITFVTKKKIIGRFL